ncbi:OmpA family protein [Rufibacter sp. XAAS-G3-1]|uniref:OmpA family protein n=1 Tax=Rufibacter sp. XAAS-G3-1 TaxID=2729134 RepID=UPI0015E7BC46|nr:OmpA family protein [Rufibacter sp. XAAS-G3-1]
MNHLDKRLFRTSLFFLTLFLMASTVMAQSTRKLVRSGDKLFNQANFRAALPYYERALERDPNNAKAMYRAGISLIAFDKEKASEYVYKAYRMKPNVDDDVFYWLGRVDLVNYEFDNAIKNAQAYQASLGKRDTDGKEQAALLIQHARNAKREVANPKDFFVKNLGPTINTPFSEHSPVISSDDNYLLFTSRSAAVTGGKEAADGEYFEDIFESRRLGVDSWETPKSLSSRLNGTGHDASIQLFDNDSKLLMYRQDEGGDIFVTSRDGGDWGQPQKLGKNINSKGFESDAFITRDGSTLYFSTSQFSENGDLDIYYAQRQPNGDWGAPKNFGNNVNTAFDEDSPYFTADGLTMYFSSRGHNTMGGYDIFTVKFDTVARRWSRPENMGYPVNTPDDDTYYRLSPDGSYAYLSSYRMGGYGEKDIYTINYIRNANVRGHVYSLRDSTIIPGVELVFTGTTASNAPLEYRDVTKPDSGNYQVSVLSARPYQVTLTRDGRTLATEQYEVPLSLSDTTVFEKDFYIAFEDTSGVGTGAFVFKRIYYDTDKYNLRPESISELDNLVRVMKANPSLRISIDGHTDSRASDAYNVTLGENRAMAAYNYLIKQGIPSNRMITVSYGERRPAAPNDSPENMQLNRRTEFNVIRSQEEQ